MPGSFNPFHSQPGTVLTPKCTVDVDDGVTVKLGDVLIKNDVCAVLVIGFQSVGLIVT